MISRAIILLVVIAWSAASLLPVSASPPTPKALAIKAKDLSKRKVCSRKHKTLTTKKLCHKWDLND